MLCTNEKNTKKRVCTVKDADFAKRLHKMCLAINNPTTKEIMKRISCTDLVAVEAKYHEKCYRDNISNMHSRLNYSGFSSSGRPKSTTISNNMQIVFDYINDSNDYQFSLKELHNVLGNEKNL